MSPPRQPDGDTEASAAPHGKSSSATTVRRRPSLDSDTDSSSSSDAGEQDFTQEDTEWQDVEGDEGEALQYTSLVDGEVFSSMGAMLDHCRKAIDVREKIAAFGLDFYGCIKLVNYCRAETLAGRVPKVESADVFQDDRYLQPVLEDDAVLFSLDELLDPAGTGAGESNGPASEKNISGGSEATLAELRQQLETLRKQFSDYRAAVETTLEQRWSDRDEASNKAGPTSSSRHAAAEGSRAPASSLSSMEKSFGGRDDDSHYFDSYSYNDIHETMLKDTVRTSSYRDFIYDNKNLLASTTVLDIGCGTGILSMFCAKAGAKKVYAVDNSAIITKCRENVAANGLSDTISCVRGKVEEVDLPNLKDGGKGAVDIIVSEWMGYCLLYESMLDSVLDARDRFLKPGSGIMAPSHCTLRVAPICDEDYIADAITFWNEVYGFDMNAMTEKIYDDVVVRSVGKENLVADSATFRTLDLYTVTKEDLEFEAAPFEVVLDRDVDEGIDAWCIWFDTFFLTKRNDSLEHDAKAEEWPAKNNEDRGVAFTTGPGGKETHWRAGLLVIDHRNKGKKLKAAEHDEGLGKKHASKKATPLTKGQKIRGMVGYKKRESNSRELDIEIAWEVEGSEERGRQVWCLR